MTDGSLVRRSGGLRSAPALQFIVPARNSLAHAATGSARHVPILWSRTPLAFVNPSAFYRVLRTGSLHRCMLCMRDMPPVSTTLVHCPFGL
jgi:hypothetical protein